MDIPQIYINNLEVFVCLSSVIAKQLNAHLPNLDPDQVPNTFLFFIGKRETFIKRGSLIINNNKPCYQHREPIVQKISF